PASRRKTPVRPCHVTCSPDRQIRLIRVGIGSAGRVRFWLAFRGSPEGKRFLPANLISPKRSEDAEVMRSASATSSQPARARPWKTLTSGRCCFCERDTAGWSRLPLTPDNAGGLGNLSELPAAAQPVAASLLKAHAHQLSAGG